MLLLDITVVSVALPSIQRDLHASLSDLQWVSAAYALVLAVLLLPAATLGDRLGRRPAPPPANCPPSPPPPSTRPGPETTAP
jgi:MFS family permease